MAGRFNLENSLPRNPRTTGESSSEDLRQELATTRAKLAELERALEKERRLRCEWEKSELDLREQAARSAFAIESTGAGIVDWDIASGTVEFSDNWLSITGYTRGELVPRLESLIALVHPDDLPVAMAGIEEVFAGRKAIHASEHRLKHKEGHWIWLRSRSLVSSRNKNHAPMRMIGTHVDISEGKRAQDALRESETRFRVLADGAPVILFVDDPDGGVQFVNRTYCEYFGITPEEAEGGRWYPLVHPDDSTQYLKSFMRAVREQVPFHEELRIRRADGQWRSAETIAEPRMSPTGEYLGHVGIIVDLTDRKLAEQERARLQNELLKSQKLESVGLLAGGVAHDFNNMLAVIIGGVELALQQVQSSEIRNQLIEVLTAANRSADLTQQLLAFARKQPIIPKPIDVNRQIDIIVPMIGRLIGENICLQWQPTPDLWAAKMDPVQLDQLLTNVCVNARDAIADIGTILLTASNHSIDAKTAALHPDCIPGEFVRIAIKDDGYGMDEEALQHLFEPFFTTKRLGKGTGLGLATVYGIIQQNKGFVLVTSAPNSGSTFELFLPRSLDSVEDNVVDDRVLPSHSADETILLVEDEPTLAQTYARMLKELGYRVLTATSPSEALQLAEEHADSIQLLLTDVIMPDMNGRDLAAALSSIRPGIKHLFISGYTADIIANHGVLDAGVMFLEKPFSSDALASKVHALLHGDGDSA